MKGPFHVFRDIMPPDESVGGNRPAEVHRAMYARVRLTRRGQGRPRNPAHMELVAAEISGEIEATYSGYEPLPRRSGGLTPLHRASCLT
jgi:hypothetical protein